MGGEGNLHGVELGAEYYFNKSAKDLSLAECAFLAGINHSPNAYKPFETDNQKMQEKINSIDPKALESSSFWSNEINDIIKNL